MSRVATCVRLARIPALAAVAALCVASVAPAEQRHPCVEPDGAATGLSDAGCAARTALSIVEAQGALGATIERMLGLAPDIELLGMISDGRWRVIYYGDRKLSVEDGVIVVPVGKEIEFSTFSTDYDYAMLTVEHGGLLRALPGRIESFRFVFPVAGDFPLDCEKVCGAGRARLLFRTVPEDAFEAWRAAQPDSD